MSPQSEWLEKLTIWCGELVQAIMEVEHAQVPEGSPMGALHLAQRGHWDALLKMARYTPQLLIDARRATFEE